MTILWSIRALSWFAVCCGTKYTASTERRLEMDIYECKNHHTIHANPMIRGSVTMERIVESATVSTAQA